MSRRQKVPEIAAKNYPFSKKTGMCIVLLPGFQKGRDINF
jgi:hypothetical protein